MYGMYPMCTQYRIVVSFTFKYAASSGVFQRIACGRACTFPSNLPGRRSVVLPVIVLWGSCGFHVVPHFLLSVIFIPSLFSTVLTRRAGDTSTLIVNDQDRESVNRLTPARVEQDSKGLLQSHLSLRCLTRQAK